MYTIAFLIPRLSTTHPALFDFECTRFLVKHLAMYQILASSVKSQLSMIQNTLHTALFIYFNYLCDTLTFKGVLSK